MKYYVTMTDRFMSGWGLAEGKDNKLVITCDNYTEAVTVECNAKKRSEMRYINIRTSKPYYPNAYVSWHDKTDYPKWFDNNPGW